MFTETLFFIIVSALLNFCQKTIMEDKGGLKAARDGKLDCIKEEFQLFEKLNPDRQTDY